MVCRLLERRVAVIDRLQTRQSRALSGLADSRRSRQVLFETNFSFQDYVTQYFLHTILYISFGSIGFLSCLTLRERFAIIYHLLGSKNLCLHSYYSMTNSIHWSSLSNSVFVGGSGGAVMGALLWDCYGTAMGLLWDWHRISIFDRMIDSSLLFNHLSLSLTHCLCQRFYKCYSLKI